MFDAKREFIAQCERRMQGDTNDDHPWALLWKDEHAFRSLQLVYECGTYKLSIVMGSTKYSSPSSTVYADPAHYDRVECGILVLCGNGDNHALMGLKAINAVFGDEVAKLCEGYGADPEWVISNTVMPRISWDDVLMVADKVETEWRRSCNE